MEYHKYMRFYGKRKLVPREPWISNEFVNGRIITLPKKGTTMEHNNYITISIYYDNIENLRSDSE